MSDIVNFGYCCISLGISDNLKEIHCNRKMIKKTFLTKGLNYAADVALMNIFDLQKILKYNVEKNIFVYRMSSNMFPWMSEYELSDLTSFPIIKETLKDIGNYIKDNKIRVGFHPGHYHVLGSENPNVVKKTIKELNQHAEILDLMGLDQNTFYSINIHLNSTKPSKEKAAKRFIQNFDLLSDSCKKRLVVENDDYLAQYTVSDLYNLVYKEIKIPIILDSLHHQCNSNNNTWKEVLDIAISTWNTKVLMHHSSSKKIEVPTARFNAHADYIYEKLELFDYKNIDVEIEAKQKDLALFKYLKDFNE
jgi:UV DNA damage endonuclease